MSSPIWYRAPVGGMWGDVQSRKDAALFIAERLLEDVESRPTFVDELMEQYGFATVDEQDRAECDYCHESQPVASLIWDGFNFICEDCRRSAAPYDGL